MGFLKQQLTKAKDNKKGFTLIEIVVVLVIISILALLMLTALNSYIDEAKEKTALSDCRSVVLAAQTKLSNEYAAGNLKSAGTITTGDSKVDELSGVSGQYQVSYDKGGRVTAAYYWSADGRFVATYTVDSSNKSNITVSKSSSGSKPVLPNASQSGVNYPTNPNK